MARRKIYAILLSFVLVLPLLVANGVLMTSHAEEADFSLLYNIQEEEDHESKIELDTDEDLLVHGYDHTIEDICSREDILHIVYFHHKIQPPVIKVQVPPPELYI